MVQAIEAWAPSRKPAPHEFTSTDAADLVWFYNDSEAEFGIRSTQGGIEDRLNRTSVSRDAVVELGNARRRLKRYLLAKGASRAALDAITPEFARALEEAGRDVEYMHISDDSGGGSIDPFESDHVLASVASWRRTYHRLSAIHWHHRVALQSVHGPSKINVDCRETLRKKFGIFVPIVLVFVAAAREDGDPSALAIVLAKLSDSSFVLMQKRQAEKVYVEATTAYGLAKLADDVHVRRAIPVTAKIECPCSYVRLGQTVRCAKTEPHTEGHWFPALEVG